MSRHLRPDGYHLISFVTKFSRIYCSKMRMYNVVVTDHEI